MLCHPVFFCSPNKKLKMPFITGNGDNLYFMKLMFLCLKSRYFSTVSLKCTPFGVSRVVCGAHLRLLAPCVTRLFLQRMPHPVVASQWHHWA